jgi:hypothetical protein
MQADALALAGFPFGLDLLLLVGQLRLRAHQRVDAIHRTLTQRLALGGQRISRRAMLFLLEAYPALVRAGTEVSQDGAGKEEVREHKGWFLSSDGLQPDTGNEPSYLVREGLTGRILPAETGTARPKERLKHVLAPVGALDVPVLGVSSSAHPTALQAVAQRWPQAPQQLCQFHAIGEAGRLIYHADPRVKTARRIRMPHKTHEERQNIHQRLKEAQEKREEKQQELEHLPILEEEAAMGEGAFNSDGLPPFQSGGVAMQEALTTIQTS